MPEATIHPSLSRQLRRLRLAGDAPPTLEGWQDLLRLVSEAYSGADADRYTLERSIEVSSDEMRALHEVLSERALHDSLTGLPNRASLCALLDDALAPTGARAANLAVIYLDLDGFKRVNDSLGHAAGDELLARTSERIRSAIRSQDVAARLGGDEFVVCCLDVPDRADVTAIAQRIVDSLEAPFRIAGQNVTIGASLGIAYADPGPGGLIAAADSEEILAQADLAMYEAKVSGRSRFVVFDEQMGRSAEDRLTTENALRRALHRDELVLHFQPIVRLSDRAVIGMESLVRWNRPGYGLIGPDRFIPVAENSRLITAVDSWVLRRACAEAASWSDDELTVSVNISTRDLLHDGIAADVSAALQLSGLRASRLVLELTETTLISADPSVVRNLARIKSLGVQLAIDDFGTGYSSLSYLRELPSRSVKIDRSFITPIGEDRVAAAIVGAIITMSHAVGLTVVAEGVETQAQASQLQLLGCDHAQGYLYGRPQPAESLPEHRRGATAQPQPESRLA